MKKKVLGLDLGTNSIGWAVIDEEQEGNKLVDKGVLIFTEGVKNEEGKEKSRAAERTGFRSARHLKFRRKIRKYQTLLVLAKYGMCPLSIEEVKVWRHSNFKKYPTNPQFLKWLRTDEESNKNPYYFRDKASREKVEKYELGRAFYHFAQRRGFKSNRLDQSDKGIIEKHQAKLNTVIDETNNKAELSVALKEYFSLMEILDKKAKDLDAGEKKLKTLYNSFVKILKEESEFKEKLLERLYKKENLGTVKKGISEIDEYIKNGNFETLGQYFWDLYQKDRNNSENKIRTKYTARDEHYLAEFEFICKKQKLQGIDETKKAPSERYTGIIQELYKAIFFQRPLKSQKGLVGKCSLEPKRTRCSASRPEFELFRMYSFINTIKIKTNEDENLRFLKEEEREKIIPKFFRKSKPSFNFSDIRKVLGEDYFYNYKDNTAVSACPTIASLRNVFGDDWENAIFENYVDSEIQNRKTKSLIRKKTKTEMVSDIWHVLATFTSDEKLKSFAIEKLNLDDKHAEKFSKIQLKTEYANLSLYAINKILPYLKKGLLYSHAVFMANMDQVVKSELWKDYSSRHEIEDELGSIISEHGKENKKIFAINSILKTCFDDGVYNSEEGHDYLKSDLENALVKEFGTRAWNNFENKDEIFENSFVIFVEQLEERKFLKIKRIDEKVLDFLKGKNEDGEVYIIDDYDKSSSKKLYHPSDLEKFKPVFKSDEKGIEYKLLGNPDIGSIKNPMAMRALYQLRKLVNTLILEGTINEHTKVNIELARQLNDANKRKAIEKWQKDRRDLYDLYEKKIRELYKLETGKELKSVSDNDIEKFSYALEQRKDNIIVSKDDVLKYTLWEEQSHICLYTGKTIGLADFIGQSPNFDIEHTLPRERSWDNSQMNKTLCDSTFNRKIKKENMPTELAVHAEILPRIKHWKVKYEKLFGEIQNLKRQTKAATDKEQKDKKIQKRHYLQMEYNYWKGKHDRFMKNEIPNGFKNSQFVDIGIISKYANAFLKSVFKKVYSVKGEMVDQYRDAWGVNIKVKDENGKEKKDRSNHIHHCIDAVSIACMSKGKYDKLAHAWGLEDKGDFRNAKKELEDEKPWKTFTEDVRNLVNEVLIVHYTKDVLPIQTKKKLRKRGKIQYVLEYEKGKDGKYIRDGRGKKVPKRNVKGKLIYKLDDKGKRIPKIQQGDTVRGSLHKDTFYGAIAQDKDGNIREDENGNIIPQYVVRRELSKLKNTDIAKIVDVNIRTIIENAVKEKIIIFNNNGAKVNETIWQNKEKQIPIKKVRIYTPSVKSPLQDFKKHAKQFLSEKGYKQQFNVVNGGNYCMAIYEGKNAKGKVKRTFELVNNIGAAEYYKFSNKERGKDDYPLIPEFHIGSGFSLKYTLKKGDNCLLLKNEEEVAEWDNNMWLKSRLYIINGIDSDGIKLNHHQNARLSTDTLKFMNDVIDKQKFNDILPELAKIDSLDLQLIESQFYNSEIDRKELFASITESVNNYYKLSNILDSKGKYKTIKLKVSALTTPKGGSIIDKYQKFPYVKFRPNNFYAMIQGINFEITTTGKILPIK